MAVKLLVTRERAHMFDHPRLPVLSVGRAAAHIDFKAHRQYMYRHYFEPRVCSYLINNAVQ